MSNLSEQFDPFQKYPNVSFRHMPTPGGTGWRELEDDPESLGLEWADTYGRAGGPFGGRRGIATTVGELIVGGAVDTDFTGWGRSDGGLHIPVLGTRTSDHARGFDVEQTAGGLTAGRELDRFSFSPITEYPIPDHEGDSDHTRGSGNEYWKIPSMSVNVRIPPASRGGVPLTGVNSGGLWTDGLPWTEKVWAEHYDTETRGERGLSQTRRSDTREIMGATGQAGRSGPHPSFRANLLYGFGAGPFPDGTPMHGWQADSPRNQSLPEAITSHHQFFLQELQNYRDELHGNSEFPSEFYRQNPD